MGKLVRGWLMAVRVVKGPGIGMGGVEERGQGSLLNVNSSSHPLSQSYTPLLPKSPSPTLLPSLYTLSTQTLYNPTVVHLPTLELSPPYPHLLTTQSYPLPSTPQLYFTHNPPIPTPTSISYSLPATHILSTLSKGIL